MIVLNKILNGGSSYLIFSIHVFFLLSIKTLFYIYLSMFISPSYLNPSLGRSHPSEVGDLNATLWCKSAKPITSR